jgi:hypothetical protein
MNGERRRNRSEIPAEAAALYLGAAAARDGVEAIALGDDEGALVAGAGGAYDLRWLAAVGSAFAGRPEEHGPIEEALGEGVHVGSVEVCGKTLYLGAIGARLPPREEAARALHRIFAPTWARG